MGISRKFDLPSFRAMLPETTSFANPYQTETRSGTSPGETHLSQRKRSSGMLLNSGIRPGVLEPKEV